MKLALLLRTLPHLRWEQLAYRPWRRAQFSLYRAWPGLTARWTTADKAAPNFPPPQTIESFQLVFETELAHLRAPLETAAARWADVPDGRFTFLNHTVELSPPDWNRRCESHLWNFQLHYFEYAVWAARMWVERGEAQYWRACRALIESWLTEARVGVSDGWEAYPTALRVVNWMYAYCLVGEREAGSAFQARWLMGIYQQLDFLSRHLEYHLLANHLLKDAKALVIGGLFFGHEHWLKLGQRLLWRELDEQVLPDGGHYERAPMYHAQTLADWLECYALLRAFGCLNNHAAAPRLHSMAAFLQAVSYPDGTLAQFNDSANVEDTWRLLETAARVCGYIDGQTGDSFPHTGYFVWQSGDAQEKLVADAGAPAVDYNGAHAHCDLLSYELRFDGKPFIVDTGVHGYAGDPFRTYCRATRAHNTVQFDGREQSEVWGAFRLARRATVLAAESQRETQTWQFRGAYRPYYDRHLIHERLIQRHASGEWVIRDIAHGRAVRTAESFIHLHPAVRARQLPGPGLVIECQTDTRSILIEPFGATGVELIRGTTIPQTRQQQQQAQGWHFPTFGVAQPSPVICFRYQPPPETAFGYTIKMVT